VPRERLPLIPFGWGSSPFATPVTHQMVFRETADRTRLGGALGHEPGGENLHVCCTRDQNNVTVFCPEMIAIPIAPAKKSIFPISLHLPGVVMKSTNPMSMKATARMDVTMA
jgi:hypothetical protein